MSEKQSEQTVRFMLYLPPHLLERLKEVAKQHHRSANGEAIIALEEHLKPQEAREESKKQ
jgi:hypothetical protein